MWSSWMNLDDMYLQAYVIPHDFSWHQKNSNVNQGGGFVVFLHFHLVKLNWIKLPNYQIKI